MPDTLPEILPYHDLQVRFRAARSEQERSEILLAWTIETYKSDLDERARNREYRKELRNDILEVKAAVDLANAKIDEQGAHIRRELGELAETLGQVLGAVSQVERTEEQQNATIKKLVARTTLIKAAKYVAGGGGFLLGSDLVHQLLKAILEALLK